MLILGENGAFIPQLSVGKKPQTWYNWKSGGTWSSKYIRDFTDLYSIAYGNNKFITVGTVNRIYSSTDGNTWTQETSAASSGTIHSIIYDGSKFIAVGDNGMIMSSTGDGNWALTNTGASGTIYDIAYGNGKYVVVCFYSGRIYSSTDGTNWSQETSGVSTDLHTVAYGNGKFIVGGNSGTILVSDGDGTWTKITSSGIPTDISIEAITYGNGKFIAVPNYGGNIYISNDDGQTWSPIAIAGIYTSSSSGAEYINGKYFVLGNTKIYSSTDGEIWTQEASITKTGFVDIAFGNGIYAAASSYSEKAYVYISSIPNLCYTEDSEPTTESIVYSEPEVTSALTITSVGTGTITLSDTNIYNYNPSGNIITY